MRTVTVRWLLAGVAVVALSPAALRGQDEDEALRKRALALNKVTGDDPIAAEIRALLKDSAGTKKLLAVGAKMAQDKKQPFNYNGAIILARVAASMRDLENGQVFYRICTKEAARLSSSEKLAESYGGLIGLLFQHQKFEEGTKVCQEILDLPDPDMDPRSPLRGFKDLVLLEMIRGLARQGKTAEANKLIDSLLKEKAGRLRRWVLLEAKAQVERETGQYEESAKLYEEALEVLEKDKEIEKEPKDRMLETYRYRLSNVYVDAKKVDKAAEQLKKLLEIRPDDPTYNNDLGYIWADHDMNLDEAEKLIRKAIDEDRKQRKNIPDLPPEEDRDNAAYLDSLGWVLYKKKNFKEAREWLEKASKERDGDHVEILDHLGDAHMALGEKDQAIAAWEKAMKVPGLGKRDELRRAEVKKKLGQHKK
jgi:tetratricopeptide (TPR) repeat protein